MGESPSKRIKAILKKVYWSVSLNLYNWTSFFLALVSISGLGYAYVSYLGGVGSCRGSQTSASALEFILVKRKKKQYLDKSGQWFFIGPSLADTGELLADYKNMIFYVIK